MKKNRKHAYADLTDEQHAKLKRRAAAEQRTIKAVILRALFPEEFAASVDPA